MGGVRVFDRRPCFVRVYIVGREWEGCVSLTGNHAGLVGREWEGCVSLTGDHASCGSSRQRVGGCVSLTGDHASSGSSSQRAGGVCVSDR